MIELVTIVTTQGVKSYQVGDMIYGTRIDSIRRADLLFQGDPFDHYIGYADSGAILFSVNCLVPCIVEYSENSLA